MDKTCCPLYTIKCDAVNFKLRKSQKSLVKSFNKFLMTNESNKRRKLVEKGSIRKHSPKSDESKNQSVSHKMQKMNTETILNSNTNQKMTTASKIKDYFANNLIDLSDTIKSPNELMNIDKKLKSKHKRLFKKLKRLKEKGLINDMNCKFLLNYQK